MNRTRNNNFSKELKELFHSTNHVMKIQKGTLLFQEGMQVTELYIVRSGKIRVSKISADGKELTLSICTIGDVVNELPLYTANTDHLFTATALEAGEVVVVKKDYLEEQFKQNSPLAFEYLQWMSTHFRNTQTKLRDLLLYGKKGALYSTIIRLTNKYGKTEINGDILIDFPLNNHELALFCGTSRETVSRVLKELRLDGILSKKNEKIKVHNIDYLREEISCENCSAQFCSI